MVFQMKLMCHIRRKYEELQREVEELRRKPAEREAQDNPKSYGIQNEGSLAKPTHTLPSSQRLEDIELSSEQIARLYNE
jgi:hypothetical protein